MHVLTAFDRTGTLARMAVLVRIAGVTAFATLAWAVLMGALTGDVQLTKVQLNAAPAAVAAVRADADKLDASRLALQLDFVFLVLYGVTFVLLGLLLMRRTGRLFAIAGATLTAGAVVTCTLDVVENVRTLRLLPAHATTPVRQSALDALQTVSYAKWTGSGLTVALATLLFVGRGRARITTVLAGTTGVAALLGLAGAVARSSVLFEIYFVVLGLSLVMLAPLFSFRPLTFLRGYG